MTSREALEAQDLSTTLLNPLPCPFCGHVGLDFREGTTFHWLLAECGGCSATCGETRIQTLGEGTKDEWMQQAQQDAITVWNTRFNRRKMMTGETTPFRHLPLGARFRLVGRSDVWVVLQTHGCGLVAAWKGNILQFVGQAICCAEETEAATDDLRVILLPDNAVMTSCEAFEAKYGKRGDRLLAAAWDIRLSVWQAAERDMLERCVEAVKKERLTDNTNEPTNVAYNTAISHVLYKLKELLNEQH